MAPPVDTTLWAALCVCIPAIVLSHVWLFRDRAMKLCYAWRWLREAFQGEKEDVFTPFVQQHLEARRKGCLKWVYEWCLLHPLCMWNTLLAVVQLNYAMSPEGILSAPFIFSNTQGNMFVIICWAVFLIVYGTCFASSVKLSPRIPEGLSSVLLYSVPMIAVTIVTSRLPDWAQAKGLIAGIRMALGASVMHLPMTAIMNVVYYVSYLIQVKNADMEVGAEIFPELGILIATCMFSKIMELMITEEALSTLTARASRNERAALTSILDATCDVVVQLDMDSCIVGAVPKLASMLLYDTSEVQLEGMRFEDLFASETDADGFAISLAKAHPDEEEIGMAQALNVRLRDRLKNVVAAKMLHARFIDFHGQVGYLIGLTASMDPASEARLEGERAKSRLGDERPLGQVTVTSRRRSNLGTPRNNEPEAVGSLKSGRSSRSAASSSHRKSQTSEVSMMPAVPGFVTSQRAQELTLGAVTMSWNYMRHRVVCCPYHAAMKEIARVHRIMAKKTCCQDFSVDTSTAQCTGCGLVGPADPSECFVCQSDLPSEGARTKILL